MEFDKTQSRCINFDFEKPLMILAGPGSGKTKTIIGRISHMCKTIPPNEILALCFSRKACFEMQDRIFETMNIKLGNYSLKSLTIKTFHSFCLRILRDHHDRIDKLNAKFVLITSKQQRVIIRKILSKKFNKEDVESEEVTKYLSRILKIKVLNREIHDESLKEIVETFNKELRDKNLVDFSDLLLLTVDLFKTHSDVLELYRSTYKYILVDEFQDLNVVQFEILKFLSQESHRITIVGDEDQSIYGFRGGSSRLFQTFRELFPNEYVEIKLERNYRSTKNIVNSSCNVIKKNKNRTEKNLYSEKGDGEKIDIVRVSNENDEVKFIVGEIRRIVREYGQRNSNQSQGVGGGKRGYQDIAVLCRQRKNILGKFEREFKEAKIPILKVRKNGINERIVSSTILGYLSLICSENDDLAFESVINIPPRKLGESFLGYLNNLKNKNNYKSLMQTVKYACKGGWPKIKGVRSPNKSAKENAKKFVRLIKSFRGKLDNHDLYSFISYVVTTIDLGKEIKKKKRSESISRNYQINSARREGKGLENMLDEDEFEFNFNLKENLREIRGVINQFFKTVNDDLQDIAKSALLQLFVDHVRGIQKEDEVEEERDKVFVNTIHQSKGLEFKHVFLVRANEGVTPSVFSMRNNNQKGNEEGFEEERRLMYVGMTRAKDKLVISCVHNRKEELYPSSFLQDIPGNNVKSKTFGQFQEPKGDYAWKVGPPVMFPDGNGTIPLPQQQKVTGQQQMFRGPPQRPQFNPNPNPGFGTQRVLPRQRNGNVPFPQRKQSYQNRQYGYGNDQNRNNNRYNQPRPNQMMGRQGNTANRAPSFVSKQPPNPQRFNRPPQQFQRRDEITNNLQRGNPPKKFFSNRPKPSSNGNSFRKETTFGTDLRKGSFSIDDKKKPVVSGFSFNPDIIPERRRKPKTIPTMKKVDFIPSPQNIYHNSIVRNLLPPQNRIEPPQNRIEPPQNRKEFERMEIPNKPRIRPSNKPNSLPPRELPIKNIPKKISPPKMIGAPKMIEKKKMFDLDEPVLVQQSERFKSPFFKDRPKNQNPFLRRKSEKVSPPRFLAPKPKKKKKVQSIWGDEDLDPSASQITTLFSQDKKRENDYESLFSSSSTNDLFDNVPRKRKYDEITNEEKNESDRKRRKIFEFNHETQQYEKKQFNTKTGKYDVIQSKPDEEF